MNQQEVTNEQLTNCSGWGVARLLGCHYSGDSDPIKHDGYFYNTDNWEKYGYANCVEFWADPDTGNLVVQTGTIHKPDNLNGAFSCIGIPEEDDALRANIHCQIDACKSYCGMEPDGTRYPDLKTFNLDTWRERNIWKSVRGWIEALKCEVNCDAS